MVFYLENRELNSVTKFNTRKVLEAFNGSSGSVNLQMWQNWYNDVVIEFFEDYREVVRRKLKHQIENSRVCLNIMFQFCLISFLVPKEPGHRCIFVLSSFNEFANSVNLMTMKLISQEKFSNYREKFFKNWFEKFPFPCFDNRYHLFSDQQNFRKSYNFHRLFSGSFQYGTEIPCPITDFGKPNSSLHKEIKSKILNVFQNPVYSFYEKSLKDSIACSIVDWVYSRHFNISFSSFQEVYQNIIFNYFSIIQILIELDLLRFPDVAEGIIWFYTDPRDSFVFEGEVHYNSRFSLTKDKRLKLLNRQIERRNKKNRNYISPGCREKHERYAEVQKQKEKERKERRALQL